MIKNNHSNGSWPNANTIRVCTASMIMIIYISMRTNAPPFLMYSILVFMNSQNSNFLYYGPPFAFRIHGIIFFFKWGMARHHVILQVSYFKDLAVYIPGVLRRQKRERKSRNRSHAAHPGRLFLTAGDLCTSLWLCPLRRTSDPSTFLAIAQEQRNSWQCLPA